LGLVFTVNGRDYALVLLDEKRLPGWKPGLLHARRWRPPEDPRDRGLGEQIASGVVKNLLLLRHQMEHYSGKSGASVDPLVQKILAIGLYQMKFLDRIPAAAAVDSAVEQAKNFGRGRAAGFVNAVLRNVARMPEPPMADEIAEPALFAQRVLSHPPVIFERLAKLLGAERAMAFCRHDNSDPPIVLRMFQGIEPADLILEWEQLRNQFADLPDVELRPHESPGLLVVRGVRGGRILGHWAKMGLAQVQDATAAGVVEKMRISPGMRVLDRCAGLGTKTMQIWERAGITGEVMAMDASEFRCQKLGELVAERGIGNVRTVQAEKMSGADQIGGVFERILVDVPCSNSGVLARRPEARYRDQMDCLVKLQRDILDDTQPWLGPGGILVYSTCSVWPEENELQVKEFLASNAGLELIEECSTLPSMGETAAEKYHDGGYFAVVWRNAVSDQGDLRSG
jgi:16S rRNA (cytosine967-C5)-methyltransferase